MTSETALEGIGFTLTLIVLWVCLYSFFGG